MVLRTRAMIIGAQGSAIDCYADRVSRDAQRGETPRRGAPSKSASLVWIAALSIGLLGSEFEGCGGPPDHPDATVPVMGGCLSDDDCVPSDMCSVSSCVLGTCMESPGGTDSDGDGFTEPPCGEDCNDRDPTMFPGAAELCDGIDQDCDSEIDEGATGVRVVTERDGLSSRLLAGLDDELLIVGPDGAGDLQQYRVGLDGRVTGLRPVAIAEPTRTVFDVAVAADGDVILVTASSAEPGLRRHVLVDDGLDLIAEGAPTVIGDDAAVTSVRVAMVGDEDWIVWDHREGSEVLRSVVRSSAPSSIEAVGPSGVGLARPAMASDGAHVYIAAPPATVAVFALDGARLADVAPPGPFAAGPLTSVGSTVYVAYRDAFDHALAEVTATGTGAPALAPAGPAGDELFVYGLANGVLVIREGSDGLRAWVLSEDLGTYIATFDEHELTGGSSSTREGHQHARTGDGTDALLTGVSSTARVAFFGCGP